MLTTVLRVPAAPWTVQEHRFFPKKFKIYLQKIYFLLNCSFSIKRSSLKHWKRLACFCP